MTTYDFLRTNSQKAKVPLRFSHLKDLIYLDKKICEFHGKSIIVAMVILKELSGYVGGMSYFFSEHEEKTRVLNAWAMMFSRHTMAHILYAVEHIIEGRYREKDFLCPKYPLQFNNLLGALSQSFEFLKKNIFEKDKQTLQKSINTSIVDGRAHV